MEKDRIVRVVSLLALIIAILGVSIGFSAWSATLKILGATVNVSSSQNDTAFKNLITITNVTCSAIGTATASSTGYGTVSGDGFTWTGVEVGLAKTGDSVTCTGTVSNQSSYIAYFKTITIGNGTTNQITCNSSENSEGGQGLDSACNSLKLSVWANDNTTDVATVTGSTTTNRVISNIESTAIGSKSVGSINFKIEYEGTGITDSSFVASLPIITFGISSVD